jgi:hypothetical protein
MKCKHAMIWKKAIIAYLKALLRHTPNETEEKREKRLDSVEPVEIETRYLLNASPQSCLLVWTYEIIRRTDIRVYKPH